MFDHESFLPRCRALVSELSRRECWGLSDEQILAYADQIVHRIPGSSLSIQLEQLIRYFHVDHELHAALRNEHSPNHLAAWAWVQREVARTAQSKGLGWSRDRSVELSDLVQTVQAEVARALPDYRFESSLRTWLQGVTLRRLRRFHRDGAAAKRAVVPEPLEAASEHSVEWHDLEPEILAGALLAEITRVLKDSGDNRFVQIVQLSLVDDRTTREIGERVHLHASRVRVLLKIARTLLQEDAALRDWYEGEVGHDSRRQA